jgi:hypothetical protein
LLLFVSFSIRKLLLLWLIGQAMGSWIVGVSFVSGANAHFRGAKGDFAAQDSSAH